MCPGTRHCPDLVGVVGYVGHFALGVCHFYYSSYEIGNCTSAMDIVLVELIVGGACGHRRNVGVLRHAPKTNQGYHHNSRPSRERRKTDIPRCSADWREGFLFFCLRFQSTFLDLGLYPFLVVYWIFRKANCPISKRGFPRPS